MLATVFYFLQVILCSGVMMGYYWWVLRNKRFHQYNRFYLLFTALASWLIPLIKIQWTKPVQEEQQVVQLLSVVADSNTELEQNFTRTPFDFLENWQTEITSMYFITAAILLIAVIKSLYRVYKLFKKHSCKQLEDIYLVSTREQGTPFSFFRYIFWNEDIDLTSEAGQQILQHELTHVRQKHSIDKLCIQLLLVGGWFNPFFWLLRREMDMIHEFIADKKAVNNGDSAILAQMLLTAAYPKQQFALTNAFFFSPIKRRLQMFSNPAKTRFTYMRRLIVLPLLAVMIIMIAFRTKESREDKSISVASVVENIVDAVIPGKESKPGEMDNSRSSEVLSASVVTDTVQTNQNIDKEMANTIVEQPLALIADTVYPKNVIIATTLSGMLRADMVDPNNSNVTMLGSVSNLTVISASGTALGQLKALSVTGVGRSSTLSGQLTRLSSNITTVGQLQNLTVVGTIGADNRTNTLPSITATTLPGNTTKPNITATTLYNDQAVEAAYNDMNHIVRPVFSAGNWNNYIAGKVNQTVPKRNGAPPGKYEVAASWIIDQKGKIRNISITADPGYGMSKELTRIVKSSPNWISATQNGVPIAAQMSYKFTFTVPE